MTEVVNYSYGSGWLMMKMLDDAQLLLESGDTASCLNLVERVASKEARQAVERWGYLSPRGPPCYGWVPIFLMM